MLRVLTVVLLMCASVRVPAQLLNPDSVSGALFGAWTGAILGGDYHGCHSSLSGEGAAIGAGLGFLAGSLIHASRPKEGSYDYGPAYVAPAYPAVSYSVGVGYSSCGGPGVSLSYSAATPVYSRAYAAAPYAPTYQASSYTQPAVTAAATSPVTTAPSISPAPPAQTRSASPARTSRMSAANRLFGR